MEDAHESRSKNSKIRATTRPPASRDGAPTMQRLLDRGTFRSRLGALRRGVGASAVVALVLALVGCSGKDTTTGKRVTLQTRAVADAETEGEFLTSFGW